MRPLGLADAFEGVKFVHGTHDEVVGAWVGAQYIPRTEFAPELQTILHRYLHREDDVE